MSTPKEAWDAAIQECIDVCELFADENFKMATDTIIIDPLLSASRRRETYVATAENEALVEKCQADGMIHSIKAHAANDIVALLKALKHVEPTE